MRKLATLGFAVPLTLAACMTNQTGSRLPDGTLTEFSGAPWMQDAIAVPWTSRMNGSANTERAHSSLMILFSDQQNLCPVYQGDTMTPNSKALRLVVRVRGDELPQPGDYRIKVQSYPVAYAVYTTTDEQCEASQAGSSGYAGGWITIDEVTPTTVTGSYRIWFRFGTRMEGNFKAGMCPWAAKHAPRTCGGIGGG